MAKKAKKRNIESKDNQERGTRNLILLSCL